MKAAERIVDNFNRYGSNFFLVDSLNDRFLTYQEFYQIACNLAAEMERRGITYGDRIAILFPNCAEFAAIYFASIFMGAVVVPINHNLTDRDIAYIFGNSRAKHILYAPSLVGKIPEVAIRSKLCIIPEHEKDKVHADIDNDTIDLKMLKASPSFIPLKNYEEDDLVAIMYTSGTMAYPKGVAHLLKNMFANAQAFIEQVKVTDQARFYATLSMSYMAGFFNLLLLPFLAGASVIISNTFDAKTAINYWEVPMKYKANSLWFIPTIMSMLLKIDRDATGQDYCRKHIRHAFVGTAPLPVKIKLEFEKLYGIRVLENYGLSETLFVSTESPDLPYSKGSVGRCIKGIDVRIVDEKGDTSNPGAEGEILIKTEYPMKGYLDIETGEINPPAKWFETGDIGFIKGQNLYITGRRKDLIIRGGINISPRAIEEELVKHEAVDEVYVVGIPHEIYGEDIAVVLKLKALVNLEDVKASLATFAQKNLAPHQQPAIYINIDDFPRSVTGKVQKHRLRELVINKFQLF